MRSRRERPLPARSRRARRRSVPVALPTRSVGGPVRPWRGRLDCSPPWRRTRPRRACAPPRAPTSARRDHPSGGRRRDVARDLHRRDAGRSARDFVVRAPWHAAAVVVDGVLDYVHVLSAVHVKSQGRVSPLTAGDLRAAGARRARVAPLARVELRAAHRLTAARCRRRVGLAALLQLERDGADARARAAARRDRRRLRAGARTGSTCSVRRTWSAAPPRSSGSAWWRPSPRVADQGGRARRGRRAPRSPSTRPSSPTCCASSERACRRRREQHRLQQRYPGAHHVLPIRSCDRTDAPTRDPPAHRPRAAADILPHRHRRAAAELARRRVRHPLGQRGRRQPEHLRLRTRSAGDFVFSDAARAAAGRSERAAASGAAADRRRRRCGCCGRAVACGACRDPPCSA